MSKVQMFEKQYKEVARNLTMEQLALVEQTPAPPEVWDSPVLSRAHELYTTVRLLRENLGPVLLRHDLFNY